MALVHDGFGGYIEESELSDDYVHGGYVEQPELPFAPTVNEIAEDAIEELAALITDVNGNELSRSALAECMQDYEEELAYLRQALKEARND